MDNRINGLVEYLNNSHSAYHAVANLVNQLEQLGYTPLCEQDAWELTPGGKYYLQRGGSSLIAFRLPEGDPTGFMMSASHSDRPTFQVKENLELKGQYTRLATEGYGGMLMSTWMDRPLSIAGRVFVKTEEGVASRLVDIDKDLLLIPNVAIHMNRAANDGMKFNPAVDTLPLLGSASAEGKLKALLEEQAGGPVLGHDLFLYVRQKAAVWGVDEEYISAPALDDLACVWCCAQGFMNAQDSAAVPVLCVFDNEEVGSASFQGANTAFLHDVLERICKVCGWELSRMLSGSFMVSADNGHALHPNHPEYSDAGNAPLVNGGVVLKFQSQRKYTTDGFSAAVFRSACRQADVPVQQYYNRADLPGGSTLGGLSQTKVTVASVDVGLPQLAMHSSFETAGVKDVAYLLDVMTAYYGMSIERSGTDAYIIK